MYWLGLASEAKENTQKTLTQARCRRLWRPSLSVISAAFMAFCKEVSDCCTQMLSIISYRKILLVGKDKEKSVAQLILVEHALKFLTSLDNTISVVGVDNKDDTLGILKVMSPERSNLVLATNVPNCELDVLVLDGLNVETCKRGQ